MLAVASSTAASSLGLAVCLRMPGSQKAYDILSAEIYPSRVLVQTSCCGLLLVCTDAYTVMGMTPS